MGKGKTGTLGFILLLTGTAGCDSVRWKAAEYYVKARRFPEAVRAYEDVAKRSLSRPRACEAMIKAAGIYAKELGRCQEARRHYEAAARGFEELKSCVDSAKAGLLTCPDYFPLDAGRAWVYGDSSSKGRNMRQEQKLIASKDGKREIVGALYAGKKKISDDVSAYAKEDWAIWEIKGSERTSILRYPFSRGTAWAGRSGGFPVDYLVEQDQVRTETQAGVFEGCLKVRERDRRFPDSWKYTYYAPGVGRVKTTVGGAGFEEPNTELLLWKK